LFGFEVNSVLGKKNYEEASKCQSLKISNNLLTVKYIQELQSNKAPSSLTLFMKPEYISHMNFICSDGKNECKEFQYRVITVKEKQT
jgi:hypothetical protein